MSNSDTILPPTATDSRCKRSLSAEECSQIRRNPPRNLRLPEAAAYLTISERKLYDLVKRRRIPVVRLGGRLVFRLEDLDGALARRSK